MRTIRSFFSKPFKRMNTLLITAQNLHKTYYENRNVVFVFGLIFVVRILWIIQIRTKQLSQPIPMWHPFTHTDTNAEFTPIDRNTKSYENSADFGFCRFHFVHLSVARAHTRRRLFPCHLNTFHINKTYTNTNSYCG